ncbi:hypothetical protein pb186bvf_008767 [Paramecium bursaria]
MQDVNQLLSEIDALMNRIGDNRSNSPIPDLKQTGSFAVSNTPKKFSATPTKQHIKFSSSSSSSSSEHKYSKKKKSVISYTKTQITQPKQIIKTDEVFCVICEDFIPLYNVNSHLAQCQQAQDLEVNVKIEKLQILLEQRVPYIQDQGLVTLVRIIVACVTEVLNATDSYSLQKCLEDLCVLKNQLQSQIDPQSYNILIVTGKLQEYCQRKQELHNKPMIQSKKSDIESHISYQTNQLTQNTNQRSRKRLFDQTISKPPLKQFTQCEENKYYKKQGVEYGANFDSNKKREFIQLSNSKIKQLQRSPPQEIKETKKKQSIISGISGFLSKFSLNGQISNNQGQEMNKKKFFEIAVRLKNQLPQNHPAREVLISLIK